MALPKLDKFWQTQKISMELYNKKSLPILKRK
jgi:hypothetical protein